MAELFEPDDLRVTVVAEDGEEWSDTIPKAARDRLKESVSGLLSTLPDGAKVAHVRVEMPYAGGDLTILVKSLDASPGTIAVDIWGRLMAVTD